MCEPIKSTPNKDSTCADRLTRARQLIQEALSSFNRLYPPHGTVPVETASWVFSIGNCLTELKQLSERVDPIEKKKSKLEEYAEDELRRAGFYNPDSDYNGLLPRAVMSLIRAHTGQGHSGVSSDIVLSIFVKLAHWSPLSPLTNDPEEWMSVGHPEDPQGSLWQSKRDPSCFSKDGGITYYSLEDDPRVLRVSEKKK